MEKGCIYKHRTNALLDPMHLNASGAWSLEERTAHCRGHLGIEKTTDRIGREYYWKGYYRDVAKYVRSCDLCQRYKVSQHAEVGLMDRREVEEPWSDVSADLMEFPQSKSRNKYFIVFEDLFTRWIKVKPVLSVTDIAVQKALEDLVVFRWGIPRRLIVDNGSEFTNKRIAKTVRCYGIELLATSLIITERIRQKGVIAL